MSVMPDDDIAAVRRANTEVQQQLDERTAERDEAKAQAAAMAEVLEAINGSGGDLAPAFDVILDKALHLCDAAFGGIFTPDGDLARYVAFRKVPQPFVDYLAREPVPLKSLLGPGFQEHAILHVADVAAGQPYRDGLPVAVAAVELGGVRSILFLPLVRDDRLVGVFSIYRQEVRPFSNKQIAILKNFAAQAVVALENARLLTEQREALAQQTATAEVLQVINRSPGDLEPVFDVILEKAQQLCEATFGIFSVYDGTDFRSVVMRGVPPAYDEFRNSIQSAYGTGTGPARILAGEDVIHISDMKEDDAYRSGEPHRRALVDLGGARTALIVALRRGEAPLGAIVVYRQEVRPYSDKQIAILQNFAAQAVVALENARLLTEQREALEQQTATAEILRVINSSQGNLAPVFDIILEKAHSLCGVPCGSLQLYDGTRVRAVAVRGIAEPFASVLRQGYQIDDRQRRLALDPGQLIHNADLAALLKQTPNDAILRAAVELGGIRTFTSVPLRKDGTVLGRIVAARQEVRPFTEKQIALLQSFAEQAVIAIENARLINETREALAQRTATAEVLQVINRSPGDLEPVFEAMLEKATRVCNADTGLLSTYDGAVFHLAAIHGMGESAARLPREPLRPHPETGIGRIAAGEAIVHIHDSAAGQPYQSGDPARRMIVDIGGARSQVSVALRKDGQLLGAFTIWRRTVRPFSDKEIALLQNFAEQAVIAMENARLLNETRESLDQQTAMSDILRVISQSPADVAPVLNTVAKAAVRFCGAEDAVVVLRDGDEWQIASHEGRMQVSVGIGGPLNRETAPGRAIIDGKTIHFPDISSLDPLQHASAHDFARRHGFNAALAAPMLREGTAIGSIALRKLNAGAFTPRQIELLEAFAAQAAIAIENVRLFDETKDALERQTAAADVLQVISNSPGELGPVFRAVLENATRICDAKFGTLFRYEGNAFHYAADVGTPAALAEVVRRPGPFQGVPGGMADLILRTRQVQHVADYADAPVSGLAAKLGGARSTLGVPILKNEALVGAIIIYRQEVRPFSEREIALVQSFAAQAAIAMENARLFNETMEALEKQTAMAEILRVISGAATDVQSVFQAIVTRAAKLCEAEFSGLAQIDDGLLHVGALNNLSEDEAQAFRSLFPRPPKRDFVMGRAFVEGRTIHVDDVLADPDYDPKTRAVLQSVTGYRTFVGVPILRDGKPIGVIGCARRTIRPFTPAQIELVTTFADQAVIAIENARLINETRERTRDLQESLEYQTATSDVLKVISRSAFDLQPVLDTLVETAARLCTGDLGALAIRETGGFRMAATYATSPEYGAFIRDYLLPEGRGSMSGRVALARQAVQVADLAADADFAVTESVTIGGFRTAVSVPLMRDGEVVGSITVGRTRVEPFTERQVELLRTFADQAVIAMENARLLNELRQRTRDLTVALDQQTATADMLSVMSRSKFDLEPILQSVVDTAVRLCRADQATLSRLDGDVYRFAAGYSLDPAYLEREGVPIAPGPGTVVGRAAMNRAVAQIDDAMADELYEKKADAAIAGIRSMIGVPLMRDGEPIGVIALARTRVEAFTENEIELVRTFADQAVIAIENTRLLTELRESLGQQQAMAEVLQAINSSPGELGPVFDAILEKAQQLCEAAFGIFTTYDGENLSRAVAMRGVPPPYAEFRKKNRQVHGPGTGPARVVAGENIIHIADMKEEDAYRSGDTNRRALVDLGGARTALIVALRTEQKLRGMITVYRQEVRPFSDKQIALLQNFADQAVIAMDNARLLGEIRQRQAELRVTFDNMGDGVAMFDADLKLAAWNRNFQEILELPDTLLEARPTYPEYIRELARRGEFTGSDVEAEVDRRLAETDQAIRLERTRPDGRVIEVRRNPVPGGGFVLIYSDITERKRAEAQVRAARDAAERALGELKTAQASLIHAEKMASLGQLTAGIAHEIKNPLNFVNNFAGLSVELLGELKAAAAPAIDRLDAEARADIDETMMMLTGNLTKIAEHGRRADGIVKSMLAHSRGSSGERQKADLNALVEEALNLAYHGARAQDQSFNITLERDLAPGLAPVELVPQDVTRVFLNLIGNGFHAAHKRQRETKGQGFSPSLRVSTRELDGAVEIRVRDNGTGISPEHMEKLFQPFFTTKPTGEGTGLGLSISYDIVTQQHGGSITVDSVLGDYTEFTVRLPRRREATAGRSA